MHARLVEEFLAIQGLSVVRVPFARGRKQILRRGAVANLRCLQAWIGLPVAGRIPVVLLEIKTRARV